uniref:Period circadian protein homolog 2 n=1 Tax=Cyprinus carpio TaxID=7962 RepID=A0A8C2KWR8_CYPCA
MPDKLTSADITVHKGLSVVYDLFYDLFMCVHSFYSRNSHSPSPPSSNAYSLLSASSEQDNPSTSGCSSEESAKAKTQKELIKTLKELKLHLPPEKQNKGSKSTTLSTLKYALRCVRQVEANEEYYQLLMINDSQPSGFDVSSYTIEEIDSITSEYTLKNTDIFAVAVSLITGKIVYISDQAASILNCKRDVFKNAKFVEFLTPQDVSVFYSFTTPYRLPSWSMCTGAESSPSDCMQEKSFFCRISGGKECEGDLQYYPFRMTPYLMKVQDTEHSEDQFCCLLLAERVHSGYEAPRIPTDKRIFTTTHTPSCVFQDVDERAVPLLGYLPQDLIGTPVLLHLHPSDRPIMLGIHRKILQYAGQPFDHSIRFCARNGEYITIDTSWSSFVNPWSRKVSFVIGRHKVRMGPVNEDVFAAPAAAEGKSIDSDIQDITEQIHRLLLQPIHNNGSSGYGSLGSNDHLLSVASSSESNSNGTRLRQEEEDGRIAKPVSHMMNSSSVALKSVCSAFSLCSDVGHLKNQAGLSSLDVSKKPPGSGVVSPSLTPLALPSKPESVMSITSQCSYSSTIVHVGDKKGQGLTVPLAAVSPHNQEREAYKKLGLTKQVLAAHTQKEEQAFLSRFRELRGVHAFKADCSLYLEKQKGQVASEAVPIARSCKQGGGGAQETTGTRRGRSKKTKSKRIKANESSDSTPSGRRPPPRPQLQGLNQTSWSPSDTSQSTFPIAYPAVMPAYPLQMYPGPGSVQPRVDAPLSGFGESQCSQDPCIPMQPIQTPYSTPLVTPMVALVLPNYVFPQMGGTPRQPFPTQPTFQPQPSFTAQAPFPPQSTFTIQTQFGPQNPFTPQTPFPPQPFPFACPEAPPKPPEPELREEPSRRSPVDGQQSDAFSSSSDLLEILPEDSHSGTGSATSGSMGSGSNGCGTSASRTGSSNTSNNSSNYFASVDSSQKSHKAKGQGSGSGSGALGLDGSETLIKYALQDPLWLLMANVDKDVMMSYQLPSRDIQTVLREDREKLRLMQKSQPRFTEEQRRELLEVHPWMRRGGLPKAFDVKACVGCEEVSETLTEEDPPDLHMGETESNDVTAPPTNSSKDSTHSETHGFPDSVT